ncbi:MAG: ABC transporter substrate-binding protein [Planctomycetota bacterium]|jgi:tungstate transport system substrate-binding protein
MHRNILIAISLLGLLACICSAEALSGEKILKMATTTSTQASGLLDVLLPELVKDTGIKVKVIAKGTGAAIRDGMDGNVDVIFVHAKSREEKFVKNGYGTRRYAVMHNDFVILGPPDDPAKIKGVDNAATALKNIAASNALFISRGDDSGTHTKEQELWKSSGLALGNESHTIVKKGKKRQIRFLHPKGLGERYLSIGQGMGKTITFADEKRAYTLADRGTYIKYKLGRDIGIDLDVLFQGDSGLANPYGVIPVNTKKHPHVRYDLAEEFVHWLISSRGQSVIANYKLHGKQLFYPDAIK